MRAFEVMATVSNSKQLLLDSDLDWDTSRVKVIILESDEVEFDPDDTPVAHIPQLRAEKKIVHLYYFFLRRFIVDFNNFIKNPV